MFRQKKIDARMRWGEKTKNPIFCCWTYCFGKMSDATMLNLLKKSVDNSWISFCLHWKLTCRLKWPWWTFLITKINLLKPIITQKKIDARMRWGKKTKNPIFCCWTYCFGKMSDATMLNLLKKSVDNSYFASHVQFHCTITNLKLFLLKLYQTCGQSEKEPHT